MQALAPVRRRLWEREAELQEAADDRGIESELAPLEGRVARAVCKGD